tara:strand:+ start:319 stop:579 length:261 start_codon:yes stop_codon:yes gene_type:complete
MSKHYGLLYINTDEPKHSEIYGIYKTYENVLEKLLICANYREKDGQLTQYMKPTDEYKNLNEIKDIIKKNNELIDVDIYRIQEIYI